GSGGGTWATKPGSGTLVTITASAAWGSGSGSVTAAGGSLTSAASGAASTGFGFCVRDRVLVRRVLGGCAPGLRERAEVGTRADIARAVGEFSLAVGGAGSG